MFENFFPLDKNKQALARFLRVLSYAWDILTSRRYYNPKKPSKNALEVDIEKQTNILMELYDYIDSMKFLGPNGRTKCPFQTGMKMAIKVALQLNQYLKTNFGLPYLLTSRITQDYLESFFGVIRQMSARYVRPTPLEFNYRVANWLKEKFLEQPDFDIFSLDIEEDEEDDDEYDEEFIKDINSMFINRELAEDEFHGMQYLGGNEVNHI